MKRYLCDFIVGYSILFWIFFLLHLAFQDGPIMQVWELELWAKILYGMATIIPIPVPFILWAYSMSDLSENRKEDDDSWYSNMQYFGFIVAPIYYFKVLRKRL